VAKIQNGGENQDGRQIVRNNANNLQLRILKDWTKNIIENIIG
jgi:hypothetical protein